MAVLMVRRSRGASGPAVVTSPGSAQLGQDELPRHRAACQPPEWPLAPAAPVTARYKLSALSLPRPPALQPTHHSSCSHGS